MEKGKVLTLEDRIPKLKAQRKQKTNRRLITYLSFFFILLLGIIYFQSPLNYINKIAISGNHFVTQEHILDKLSLQENARFWTTDLDDLRNNIMSLKEIESVTVSREFPNNIKIEVQEYDRVGFVEKDGGYYPILNNGSMLTDSINSTSAINAPILINWDDDKVLNLMAEELEKLPDGILNRISEIILSPTESDPHKLLLYMNDGNAVYATILNFSERMTSYPAIVQNLTNDKPMIIHMTVSPWATPLEQTETLSQENEEENEEIDLNEN